MATFDLRYSPRAADQIKGIQAKAASSPKTAHATFWATLKKLLQDVVANEDHATGPLTRLGYAKGVNVAPLRRAKAGRARVFFVSSSARRLSIVLMIGYRKEGDAGDAYAEVVQRLRRGEFNLHFDEAGVGRPSLAKK